MSEIMNGYRLLAPFHNENAGMSRWTTAEKNNRTYFLKEFLSPVYPMDDSLPDYLRAQILQDCENEVVRKIRLYQAINNASDGNAIRIGEFFRCDSRYYIQTEMIPPEVTVPVQNLGRLPFRERVFLCGTIAKSIYRIHKAGVIHADIKVSNILVHLSREKRPVGKVIDFDGSFFESDPPRPGEDVGGDQIYLAPETCRFLMEEDVRLTHKLDIFALGILFHEYLTGAPPEFNHDEYFYAHEAVLEGETLRVADELPAEIRSILSKMLQADPEKRPDLDKVFYVFDMYENGFLAPKPAPKPVPKPNPDRKPTIPPGFHPAGDL